MTILITGGAGFIGSNFVLNWLQSKNEKIINLDKLTYAGNLNNLLSVQDNPEYQFIKGDIADSSLVTKLLKQYKPRAIINFAAESHVDRSIHNPENFVQTNVVGTFNLLEVARQYWYELSKLEQSNFRFIQISTDEVYGSLLPHEPAFTEQSCYKPNSPYSASKASSDHLVRSYFHTYGLPTIISTCSNNYGPYQFPEKLIPLIIHNAINLKVLPIYGDGLQIRDWLYVVDHCKAIDLILQGGVPGEVYNIGGLNEKTNLDLVTSLCDLLTQLKPLKFDNSSILHYKELITHVTDRPGHDRRYAINADKIQRDLGWQAQESFETGMAKTVNWYLDNQVWISNISSGEYTQWVVKQYQ